MHNEPPRYGGFDSLLQAILNKTLHAMHLHLKRIVTSFSPTWSQSIHCNFRALLSAGSISLLIDCCHRHRLCSACDLHAEGHQNPTELILDRWQENVYGIHMVPHVMLVRVYMFS